jgi:type II secretory pathway pseudopilin PulG
MSAAPSKFHQQSGFSLIGLIVGFALIALVGLTAAKVIPAYTEFRNIMEAARMAKQNGGGTVTGIQTAFDRTRTVNDIESISGKDLSISKETGEYEISVAYERRVPLFGNATLLLEFEGTTAPASKAAPATN